jgi:hypothetical protein
MPIVKGRVRRPSIGVNRTKTTSVSFDKGDFTYIEEQAAMRQCSFALIVAEAIQLHRDAFAAKLDEVEKRERDEETRRNEPPEAVTL